MRRHKNINTSLVDDKGPGRSKNLILNSEYQGYNSDDQRNSFVTESETVSNTDIIYNAKRSLFMFFKTLIIDFVKYSPLANIIYSITEINKTKNIELQVKPVPSKRIESISPDEVDPITEINKTKNIESQIKLIPSKRIESIFLDEVDTTTKINRPNRTNDMKLQVKPVSAKRVKRISVSDDQTELVAHNEVGKHNLPRRSTRERRSSRK